MCVKKSGLNIATNAQQIFCVAILCPVFETVFRRSIIRCWVVLLAAIALSVVISRTGFAMEHVTTELAPAALETALNTGVSKNYLDVPELKVEDTDTHKSYLIPAVEIPSFILLLNGFDRIAYPNEMEDGKKVFSSTPSTFWKHLVHGHWEVDQDSFDTNQFSHPYSESLYYGFARSAGLNYWESLGYTFAGSFLWELAGETTPPSINDQVASGIAGTFLGEALFRMANLLIERSEPGFLLEAGAAVISPSAGFNRLVFGDRFKTVFPSHDPAFFWQLGLGASRNSQSNDDQAVPRANNKYVATMNYSMAYGLPGKDGYDYKRPFDYFQFEATASSRASQYVQRLSENVLVRGLLAGKKYDVGDDYRAVWGLYGCYDYISPRNFHDLRVSTTAASIGTTAQWWLSHKVALQGSLLGGIGYGAAGGGIPGPGSRDYHFGIAPQGILDLRSSSATLPSSMLGAVYMISAAWALPNREERLLAAQTQGLPFAFTGDMHSQSNTLRRTRTLTIQAGPVYTKRVEP